MPKRFIAIRVLEGDENFYRYLAEERIIGEAKESSKEHPKIAEDISSTPLSTRAISLRGPYLMIGSYIP